MMRRKLLVYTALLLLALVACHKSDIDDIQGRIDALKMGRIADVETQAEAIEASIPKVQAAQEALAAYVEVLKKDLATLEVTVGTADARMVVLSESIEKLTVMSEKMLQMIFDLKSYADTYLTEYADWAEASLMTLEKYDSLCIVVAALKVKAQPIAEVMDTVTEAYRKELTSSIDEMELSTKVWVNDKLVYYCDIAGAEARLDSLRSAIAVSDSAFYSAIDEQKAALASVKDTLTAGYKEAIETAVNEMEGRLDGKLAAKVLELHAAVSVRVEEAERMIDEMADELDYAEEYLELLLKGIQSVSVIPSYSDGSVMATSNYAVLSFDVQPRGTIKALVDSAGSGIFRVCFREVLTKSGEMSGTLPIEDVCVDPNGFLQVRVNTSSIGDSFANSDGDTETENGKSRFSVCLKICSGKMEVGSKYFDLSPVLDYFYFMSVDGTAAISMEKVGNPDAGISLYYSKDRAMWTPFVPGETKVTLDSPLDYVWFRSGNDDVLHPPFSKGPEKYYHFKTEGAGIEAGGRLELLLQSTLCATWMDTTDAKNNYKMARLFEGCSNLKSVRNLSVHIRPVEGLCYRMFYGCSNLRDVPTLNLYGEKEDYPGWDPQYVLKARIFEEMFKGCTSLTSAAGFIKDFYDLNAVSDSTCEEMFSGCVSLTVPPELPFTTLGIACYRRMFYGCSSLLKAPVLPAKKWFFDDPLEFVFYERCYSEMFSGCSSLSEIECHIEYTSEATFKNIECLKDWVKGVSSSGIFIPEPSISWEYGPDAAPEGWMIGNSRLTAVISKKNPKFGKTTWNECSGNISVNGVTYYLADNTEVPFSPVNLKSYDVNREKSPYVAYYPNWMYQGGYDPYLGVLPKTQDDSIDLKERLPMFSVSKTENLEFRNVCGVIAVKVGPEDMEAVDSIIISSANSAMSGQFSVDDDFKAYMVYPKDIASDVMLLCHGATVSPGGRDFCIVVPILTYEKLRIELFSGSLKSVMVSDEDVTVTPTDIRSIDFSRTE